MALYTGHALSRPQQLGSTAEGRRASVPVMNGGCMYLNVEALGWRRSPAIRRTGRLPHGVNTPIDAATPGQGARAHQDSESRPPQGMGPEAGVMRRALLVELARLLLALACVGALGLLAGMVGG